VAYAGHNQPETGVVVGNRHTSSAKYSVCICETSLAWCFGGEDAGQQRNGESEILVVKADQSLAGHILSRQKDFSSHNNDEFRGKKRRAYLWV